MELLADIIVTIPQYMCVPCYHLYTLPLYNIICVILYLNKAEKYFRCN